MKPSAFDRWFERYLANRGIIDYGKGEEILRHCCHEAWKAAKRKCIAAARTSEGEFAPHAYISDAIAQIKQDV